MNIIFFILGLVCTGIIAFLNVVADGLTGLFLLPLSFSIAVVFSNNTLGYAKDSFGLLILYSLIILRYLVSPVLIALSGTLVPNVSTSAMGLQFAIFIMIVELFVVVTAINSTWKPVSTMSLRKSGTEFRLTLFGAIACLFLGAVLLYRGTLQNVMAHLTFGNNYIYADDSELKTYDMSTFLLLKSFLFIAIVAWVFQKYKKTNFRLDKIVFMVAAILAAVGNSMIYQASNRATMVMGTLASVSVLSYCFGKTFGRFIPIIIVSLTVFVWTLFANGTLGVKEGESLRDKDDYISEISRVAELYSNGVSIEAHAFDMFDVITMRMDIATHISELVNSNNIFTLPGLWFVKEAVDTTPSMQRLFNETLDKGSAFILPNGGVAIYCGGKYFGLIFDIFFHWLMVYAIYFIYKNRKESCDLSIVYLYSYIEMIFGFMLMNNVFIAFSLLSAVPFLLYVLIRLNKLGVGAQLEMTHQSR
jgi:hypothetical protein